MSMTLEEALEAAAATELVEETDELCVINAETREITIPDCYQMIGVYSDECAEGIRFIAPRYVGNDLDLASMILFINYETAEGDLLRDSIDSDTVTTTTDDKVIFKWVPSRSVTAAAGTLRFVVCAKEYDTDEDETTVEWNTQIVTVEVAEGIEPEDTSSVSNSDLAASLLAAAQSANESSAEYATAAAASATAAASSASSASTSASNAATSEENAATSEENAAESEEKAYEYASEALASVLYNVWVVCDDGGLQFRDYSDELS